MAERRITGAVNDPGRPPPNFEFQFVTTAAIGLVTAVDILSFAAGFDYKVVLEAFAPTDDAEILELLLSDDNVNFEGDAGDYQWSVQRNGAEDLSASDTEIQLSGATVLGNDASLYNTIEVTLINPNVSSEQTTLYWIGHLLNGDATPVLVNTIGSARFLQGTDTVQGVRFQLAGGSTFKAQGDITVWRRKRS